MVHEPGADHGACAKGDSDCMRAGWAHAQTGMPMAALSVAGAQWRLSARDRGCLATELLPWALRSGMRCADLICLPYERHLQARLLGSRDRVWRCSYLVCLPHERHPQARTLAQEVEGLHLSHLSHSSMCGCQACPNLLGCCCTRDLPMRL